MMTKPADTFIFTNQNARTDYEFHPHSQTSLFLFPVSTSYHHAEYFRTTGIQPNRFSDSPPPPATTQLRTRGWTGIGNPSVVLRAATARLFSHVKHSHACRFLLHLDHNSKATRRQDRTALVIGDPTLVVGTLRTVHPIRTVGATPWYRCFPPP